MRKRHIGMDMFGWKEIQMRNKIWETDLLRPVQDRAVRELLHLIQDRTIGMSLHDTVMKMARGSWLHGVKEIWLETAGCGVSYRTAGILEDSLFFCRQ
jgi:hypothetical protein